MSSPDLLPLSSVDVVSAGELIRRRQAELVARYLEDPASAMVTDGARTGATGVAAADPLHTRVDLGHGSVLPLAVHRGVGGDHELPVPGDVLCAALATCCDSTIRIIARHLGVEITALEVTARGDVDLRGTLLVDREVPVGFQRMRVGVRLEVADGTPERLRRKLVQVAEHCCVVLRTLREGVPVELELAAR